MKRIIAFLLAVSLFVMVASVAFGATCKHNWKYVKTLSSKITWKYTTVNSCSHAHYRHQHKQKGWNDRRQYKCTKCGAYKTKDVFVPSTEEPEIICCEYDWG